MALSRRGPDPDIDFVVGVLFAQQVFLNCHGAGTCLWDLPGARRGHRR